MVKRKTCPTCSGTGKIVDPRDEGRDWRKKRKRSGYSLREIARRMNISAAFLSDLELGKRNWNESKRRSFWEAITE
jgi:predicted transcriptional regulator